MMISKIAPLKVVKEQSFAQVPCKTISGNSEGLQTSRSTQKDYGGFESNEE